MLKVLKSGILVFLLIATCMSAAAAEQRPIKISTSDGSINFLLTSDVLSTLENTSFNTTLPATDEAVRHVSGPLIRDVIKASGAPMGDLILKAFDGYEVVLPASDYKNIDVILAYKIDGKRFSLRERGPAWVVYPNEAYPELKGELYASRSVWQMSEIIVE